MTADTLIPSGTLKEKISIRIANLKRVGEQQVGLLPLDEDGDFRGYVADRCVAECHSWINSVANMVRFLAPSNNPLVEECNRLMKSEHIRGHIDYTMVLRMAGLLDSLEQEWEWGFLSNVEYIYVAETFDNFLDFAANYHKAGKKTESAVLASAVLEDTIKKICKKKGVTSKGRNLDPLIDDLVKNNTFTPVKAKRAKSYAGVRNHALHAEWDKFEIEDVGSMITGIRELIDQQLSQ